jgi:hypothetical protein
MPKRQAPNGLRGAGIRRREPAMVGAEARVNIQPSIDTESTVEWQAGGKPNVLKPIDEAILGMVSESPGRNESERTGGPESV